MKEEKFNIYELVTNVFNLVTLQMQMKKIQQKIDIDPDLMNLTFTGDRSRLS